MRKSLTGLFPIVAPLLVVAALAHPASAQIANAQAANDAAGASIKACRDKTGGEQFPYHRCLIDTYEAYEKACDTINDDILTIIGAHKVSGLSGWSNRRNWSAAVLQGQAAWKKFVLSDCEWPGHYEQGRQERDSGGTQPKADAGAVMIECRIERAVARRLALEGRLRAVRELYAGEAKE